MSRILIVDDEPACRDSMRLLLLSEGYTVTAVATLNEALSAAAETPPDLLLVDWMLKDRCSGLDIASRLRGSSPNLRVILTTGYSLDKVRENTADIDVESIDFLSKPFSPELLIETVRHAFECGED